MSHTLPAGSTPPDRPLPGPTADGSAGGASAPVRPAIQRAAEHLAAGRPADAVDALSALVAGAPVYAAAHVLLAVSLDAAGRPVEALRAWQRAALLVPRSPLIVRERARLMATTSTAFPTEAAPEAAPDETPEPVDLLDEPWHDHEIASTDSPVTEARLGVEVEAEDDLRDDAFEVPARAFEDAAQLDAPQLGVEGETEGEPAADTHVDGAYAEDFPELETLPLDDLATSFPPAPDAFGDDALDPDGFDFSAFDLDDEDAGWLLGQDADEPAQPVVPDVPTFDTWDDDALPPDWSEKTSDDSIQLMSPEFSAPEAPEDEPPAPPPSSPLQGEWAVFQDEPEVEPEVSPPLDAFSIPAEAPSVAQSAPAIEEPAIETPSVGDELDSLIASLEDAPRIRPDPSFSGPAADKTAADVDDMASETLARIYAAQHQYVEAAVVYEKLAARDPARAEAMLQQAAEMRRRTA